MYRLSLAAIFALVAAPCYPQADTAVFDGTTYEKFAGPQGGLPNYYNWIHANNRLKNSDTLTFNDKVFVEFVIGKDGRVSKVKTVKGIGEPYDQEAVRLIAEHPIQWAPAEYRGKAVESRLVLPVSFVDSPDKEKKRKRRS